MTKQIAALVAWIASFNVTRNFTVAYVGVPFNVLFACAVGAYCSFSLGDKIEPRSKMWSLFVMCLFLGAAFTALCNAVVEHVFKMTMTDALQAGMGCIVSFLMRFFLPWLVKIVQDGTWVSWIPFLRKKE